MVTGVCADRMDVSFESLPKKFAVEYEDLNMETPCACCGSLKAAN
ncbi:hypothetical protein HanRHA438_Chr00c80g0862871 [Helianthus annuus]|nr:hypothetical protein HanIR_Chr05g0211921 [Helianthus annuus]KAJ0953441.1 hypothetical protein HanRHA438_Chr00c80g0862871 [Helianthus annuus]